MYQCSVILNSAEKRERKRCLSTPCYVFILLFFFVEILIFFLCTKSSKEEIEFDRRCCVSKLLFPKVTKQERLRVILQNLLLSTFVLSPPLTR